MPLSLEQFRQNFGRYPIPQLLQDLLEFQNVSNEWYSDSFELAVISKEGLKTYFGENEELLSRWIEFAHDGNDSSYALWLYREMPLESAPVVYFNSEGEGNTVVANNLAEFFTLLACDQEMVLGEYPETDNDNEHTEMNQAFRVWIRERYQLEAVTHPNEVVQKAKRHHPDLQEWIEGQQ